MSDTESTNTPDIKILIPGIRVTPDEIKALRQSIDGWMEVYNTTGNGAYFTVGWAREHLMSLLAKLERCPADFPGGVN